MEIEKNNQLEVSNLVEVSSADAKKLALHFAVLMNNEDMVRLLLTNGTIPAPRSLEFALLKGPDITPIIRMLMVSAGDNIDVEKEIASVKDFLCRLFRKYQEEIPVALEKQLSEEKNCSCNQQRLFKAVKNCDINGVLVVCHHLSTCHQEVKLNEQDHLGNTPLHYAALNKNAPQICILLSHHADPNIPNYDGKTVHEYMVACGPKFLEPVYRLCRLREILANRVA